MQLIKIKKNQSGKIHYIRPLYYSGNFDDMGNRVSRTKSTKEYKIGGYLQDDAITVNLKGIKKWLENNPIEAVRVTYKNK